eukprot:1030409-Pelagomonas_calceolata.AAC.4
MVDSDDLVHTRFRHLLCKQRVHQRCACTLLCMLTIGAATTKKTGHEMQTEHSGQGPMGLSSPTLRDLPSRVNAAAANTGRLKSALPAALSFTCCCCCCCCCWRVPVWPPSLAWTAMSAKFVAVPEARLARTRCSYARSSWRTGCRGRA